jgi:hypothetical protein
MNTNYDIDFYSEKIDLDDNMQNKIKRALTTTSIFIILFLSALALYHGAIGFATDYFGVDAKYNINGFSNLDMHFTNWSVKRATLVFSLGPILVLLAGLFFLIKLFNHKSLPNMGRYITLWGSIIFLNVFFIQLANTPLSGKNYEMLSLYHGFAVVFAWWKFSGILLVPFSILAVFILFLFGYFIGDNFLSFSFSSKINVTQKGKLAFLFNVYFLPLFLSMPFVFLITNRTSIIFNILLYIGFMIVGAGIAFNYENSRTVKKANKADLLNGYHLEKHFAALLFFAVVYIFWS